MTANEMIKSALEKSGKTKAALAIHMGCTKQNMGQRLKFGRFTYDELKKALAFCGYKISDFENE